MTTGFGFCPHCGTAMTVAGQTFCASCGGSLAAVATRGAMPTPPPPAPVAPPYAWTPQGPVAPAKSSVSPVLLVVGALVILALVVGGIYAVNSGSKASPGPSGGSSVPTNVSSSPSGGNNGGFPGSIVFSPSTINCPSGPFTTTVKLPSSVNETDQITYRIDETEIVTQSVADFGMTQQPDGTWFVKDTNPDGSSNCSMGPGVHTASLLDADGQVLAQTSFTFVMSSTPKPTVKPTASPTSLSVGSVTIQPSSFSCSAADVTVTFLIRIPGSIPGTAQVTPELDGTPGTTQSVSSSFVKQSNGTWLSTDTVPSTTLCAQLDPGQHRIGALDADDQLLAEGTFTVNP